MAAGIWKYWAVRGAIIGTIASLITIAVYSMIFRATFGISFAWGPILAFVGPAALQGSILGIIVRHYQTGFRKSAVIGFLTGLLTLVVAFITHSFIAQFQCDDDPDCQAGLLLGLAFITAYLFVTGAITGTVLAWVNLRPVATSPAPRRYRTSDPRV